MSINYEQLNKISSSLDDYVNAKLLIVTKNQKSDDILKLINLGFSFFGENKVQEAQNKFKEILSKYNISLSLIGPLQTNKTKIALNLFDSIQSIDRKKLVDEIVKQKNLAPIKTRIFFIQVNIGNEPQKSGIDLESLEDLYSYAVNLGIEIQGLMCIPPNDDKCEKYFNRMYKIRNSLNKNLSLSMGMSNDYDKALMAGSNIIRIGSLIFNV